MVSKLEHNDAHDLITMMHKKGAYPLEGSACHICESDLRVVTSLPIRNAKGRVYKRFRLCGRCAAASIEISEGVKAVRQFDSWINVKSWYKKVPNLSAGKKLRAKERAIRRSLDNVK